MIERVEDFEVFPEYDRHFSMHKITNEEAQMEAFVTIHRKNPEIPSFGATRLWRYASDEDAMRDALRLSRLMSYKAALAGLPCGGAKAVVLDYENSDHGNLLRAYAKSIAFLKDDFITGTDVGVNQEDLDAMWNETTNIVGFNNNSTKFTSLGVAEGIRSTLHEAFGSDSLSQRSFAIQGLGKIGGGLLDVIAPHAKQVYIADVNPEAVRRAQDKHPNCIAIDPSEIHSQQVDVFSPCAVGSAIHAGNIDGLSCTIVAGGANNQLESDTIGDKIHEMGILYVPDYIVNAGGLIAVYDEYENPEYDEMRVQEKVLKIAGRLRQIIKESKEQSRPTNRVANERAEEIFNSYV